MTEYTRARALAKRLIQKKGRAVKIRVITNDAPADANKPWERGRTPADFPVHAVFVKFETKPIQGTPVRAGDQEVLIYAEDGIDFIITVKDKLIDSDLSVWNIVHTEPLQPGGELVMQTIWVRR